MHNILVALHTTLKNKMSVCVGLAFLLLFYVLTELDVLCVCIAPSISQFYFTLQVTLNVFTKVLLIKQSRRIDHYTHLVLVC